MKWYQYEYHVGNNPMPHHMYIKARSAAEVAAALCAVDWPVQECEIVECDPGFERRMNHGGVCRSDLFTLQNGKII